jgi:hypothetical protein
MHLVWNQGAGPRHCLFPDHAFETPFEGDTDQWRVTCCAWESMWLGGRDSNPDNRGQRAVDGFSSSYGAPAEFLDALKQVYREGGRSGVVRWVLQSQAGKLPAMQLALVHSELGDLDEAVQHLERAIDGHEPCLVELAVAPEWDRLRNRPAVPALPGTYGSRGTSVASVD